MVVDFELTFPMFDSVYILFIIYSKLSWLCLLMVRLVFVVKNAHFYVLIKTRSKD